MLRKDHHLNPVSLLSPKKMKLMVEIYRVEERMRRTGYSRKIISTVTRVGSLCH
jgi:hypothetical protein